MLKPDLSEPVRAFLGDYVGSWYPAGKAPQMLLLLDRDGLVRHVEVKAQMTLEEAKERFPGLPW